MGNSGSSEERKTRKRVKKLGLDRELPKPVCTLDDFTILKTVGKGSFGTVLQVRKNTNNKIYAMKILKKDMVIEKRQVLLSHALFLWCFVEAFVACQWCSIAPSCRASTHGRVLCRRFLTAVPFLAFMTCV
jgi:serine/threonine protein kinase